MNLMQMSLSGAVMIVVIVVIRALSVNKFPKKTFLALWGAAAVRLLIPYSFRSVFSIYSLLGRLTAAGEAANDRTAVSFVQTVPVPDRMPAPAVSANAAAVSVDIWGIVWAAGALACAVFFAAVYLKCRREFTASLPVDNEYVKVWLREHRIYRTVEIRQSGRIRTPLTYGVFRPVILMPKTTDWDDTDTLKYVLTHEYVHIRRFDALAKPVLAVILCIHWFNPAVWIMYVLANRDIELSCDEAVVRRFGERTKSAYAMTLIRMEETRSGLNPLYNHFSKNAIEERIVAIMKIKKTTLAALTAAAALVAGVITVFATSAQPGKNMAAQDSAYKPDTADTAAEDASEVEWWTYDEYKAWLEKEKIELQGMIGQKAYTGSRGEFVWTQEIVDETTAMYEGILENIKNGIRYSKTTGSEDDAFVMFSDLSAGEAQVYEGDAAASDFTIYEPYGLTWDEGKKALFWNGQRVRYFFDGVKVGDGMVIKTEYLDAGFEEGKEGIDVRTVRQCVQNVDGSFDLLGPLMGVEQYSQAPYDSDTDSLHSAAVSDAVTYAIPRETPVYGVLDSETSEEEGNAAAQGANGNSVLTQNTISSTDFYEPTPYEPTRDELLAEYGKFGISFDVSGKMLYKNKPVRWFADFVELEEGALATRYVYQNDEGTEYIHTVRNRIDNGDGSYDLFGPLLEIVPWETGERDDFGFLFQGSQINETAEAIGNDNVDGITFEERFSKYKALGITYVEADGASGRGNVYLNGLLVSRFADIAPDGSAFTFSSAQPGDFDVKTVYDDDGRLTEVEIVD